MLTFFLILELISKFLFNAPLFDLSWKTKIYRPEDLIGGAFSIHRCKLGLIINIQSNLQNNVSWGTREVAQKKSKKELEEDRKREADNAKNAKKGQKKDGILGFLMAQAGQKSQKGGLEFSLANLVKYQNCLIYCVTFK